MNPEGAPNLLEVLRALALRATREDLRALLAPYELGPFLGGGGCSYVFAVEGANDLVVKLPALPSGPLALPLDELTLPNPSEIQADPPSTRPPWRASGPALVARVPPGSQPGPTIPPARSRAP